MMALSQTRIEIAKIPLSIQFSGTITNAVCFALVLQVGQTRVVKKRSLTMTIIITAFERSPDGGMGLARDTRVHWALEEVGQSYEVRGGFLSRHERAIFLYAEVCKGFR